MDTGQSVGRREYSTVRHPRRVLLFWLLSGRNRALAPPSPLYRRALFRKSLVDICLQTAFPAESGVPATHISRSHVADNKRLIWSTLFRTVVCPERQGEAWCLDRQGKYRAGGR